MNASSPLLGGLSPAEFLERYWQKRPLLIRGAMPGFRDPLSPEELAGLACEPEVESRLVLERDGPYPWQLRYGPFEEREFLALPESHWTLLVQDVDKQAPDLAAGIVEPFRFIPNWRIDDLMISYAPAQGSVGPHVDDYDVFLLQGMGRRRWQISTQPIAGDNFLPETALRIMREFMPEQEWILEPGDMLYLPPRVAHHGVALESCLTYSIGFRAPSQRELVISYVDFLLEDIDPDIRYRDPELRPQENPGAIGAAALTKIKTLLRQRLAGDDELIESWFGRYITEPKPSFSVEPDETPWNEQELKAHLKQGGQIERNPGSRFAYIDQVFDQPPSMMFVVPVVNPDSSDAKYTTSAAISSALPIRPMGWRQKKAARAVS